MTTTPAFIDVEPRQYQIDTVNETLECLTGRYDSVMINSPTGSGKTYLALNVCRNLIHDAERLFGVAPEEVGVAWVTMRENLRTATNRDNALYRITPDQVGPLCPNLHTISMFDKNVSWFKARYKVRLLVADEGHHAACESMATMFSAIDPQKTLGLTATPFRTDSLRLCFQKEIKKAGYRALIDQGYLSQFDQYIIDNWDPKTVAETYLNGGKDRWGSSLMFFLDREKCESASQMLRQHGVTTEVVHGGSNREQQLEDFESGKVDVAISMAILSEGFDMPSLNTVFARDTQSKGLSIQMSGRAMRKYSSNNIPKIAKIVQSSGNTFPFSRFARSRSQLVLKHGNWFTIGTNDMVQSTLNIMAKKLALLGEPMTLRSSTKPLRSKVFPPPKPKPSKKDD